MPGLLGDFGLMPQGGLLGFGNGGIGARPPQEPMRTGLEDPYGVWGGGGQASGTGLGSNPGQIGDANSLSGVTPSSVAGFANSAIGGLAGLSGIGVLGGAALGMGLNGMQAAAVNPGIAALGGQPIGFGGILGATANSLPGIGMLGNALGLTSSISSQRDAALAATPMGMLAGFVNANSVPAAMMGLTGFNRDAVSAMANALGMMSGPDFSGTAVGSKGLGDLGGKDPTGFGGTAVGGLSDGGGKGAGNQDGGDKW